MEFVHVIICRMEFFLTIQMDILNEFYTASIYCLCIYVTGFERTCLPRTQQEDTLFTITR